MKIINFLFNFIAANLFFSSLAFAYIDGGTGAYILQMILIFFAACLFYIKQPYYYIKNIIKKIFNKKEK